MKILLDTHIFLWYITANKKLSNKHLKYITDIKNEIFLSAASVWECCIKQQLGKLEFPYEASEYLSEKRILHNINSITIDEESIKHLIKLPKIHKDPFDRIIICQTMEHKMKLITIDKNIKKYKLPDFKML